MTTNNSQNIKLIEDITSKEFLDMAFENSKYWCLNNLPIYFKSDVKINYDIFKYRIDNEMIGSIGSDMCFDESGQIRVSQKKIKFYQEREKVFEFEPETDPESMFIHEIAEFIINKNHEIMLDYLNEFRFPAPHLIARKIENINRKEKGLREWPYYF